MELARYRLRKAVYNADYAANMLRRIEARDEARNQKKRPSLLYLHFEKKYKDAMETLRLTSDKFALFFSDDDTKNEEIDNSESNLFFAYENKANAEDYLNLINSNINKIQKRIQYLQDAAENNKNLLKTEFKKQREIVLNINLMEFTINEEHAILNCFN